MPESTDTPSSTPAEIVPTPRTRQVKHLHLPTAMAADKRLKKFVEGLREGKSMDRAARDAGYSKSTARQATRAVMPQCREIFREVLHKKVSFGKLANRIAQGLDAKETKFAQYEGKFTDSRDVVNLSERRQMAALAANLMGLEPAKELTGEDGGPMQIQIAVVHIGGK